MFQYTMANLQDNYFKSSLNQATDGKFLAVVLSGLYSNGESTGFDLTDLRIFKKNDSTYYQIIVRPIGVTDGLILPDPCAEGLSAETRRELIELHPWATSEFPIEEGGQDTPLSPGQVVVCYYEVGSISNSTHGKLRFERPSSGAQSNPINAKCLVEFGIDMDTEEGMANLFSGERPATIGGSLGGTSIDFAEYSPSVATGAQNYDNDDSIPGKGQFSIRFANDCHPDFVPYVKAVIYDIHSILGGKVTAASTFRTYEHQKRLRDKWEAWQAPITANGGPIFTSPTKWNNSVDPNKGTTPFPSGLAARPAKAGTSNHNFGTALDFSVVIGGTTYDKSVSKENWEASGVPSIIKQHGLNWGGDFSSNYDPIHMDIRLSDETKKRIRAVPGFKTETSKEKIMKLIKDVPIT